MPRVWRRLQQARAIVRIPIKLAIFAAVVFVVLFPYPGVFARHVKHLRHLGELVDPGDAALEPVARELDVFLASSKVKPGDTQALLSAVQRFVYQRIPYAWDWDNWGVADYIPSVSEILGKGREDCDGRAVLATALLRSKGVPAELSADAKHMWVHTPVGDCMNPMGAAVFRQDSAGMHVRWKGLLDPAPLAFGISVFPIGRELVILLAAWILLLPVGTSWRGGAMAGLLMLEALVFVRLAGADPLHPRYGGLSWGGLHLLAAVVLVVYLRRRLHNIPSGRY